MSEIGYKVELEMLQDYVEASAIPLFRKLGNAFDPNVFFVAIFPNYFIDKKLSPSQAFDKYVKIIGKEKIEHISTAFSSFRKELLKNEKSITRAEPVPLALPLHWHEKSRLKGVAIGRAIEGILNNKNAGTNNVYFSTMAVWRSEFRYFICPVLKLNRTSYAQHFSLTTSTNLSDNSTSLLNLAIRNFLCSIQLELESGVTDGARFDRVRELLPNILRSSARTLMSLFWASGSNMNTRLFDDVNAVASLPYENRESRGSLILAQEDHPNLQVKVRFANPFLISEHRLVRKAIEMTGNNLHLFCDSSRIYGLGNLNGTNDNASEDLFKVDFIGQNLWRLSHDSKEMMVVDLGQPRLPAKRLTEEDFVISFSAQFGKMGKPAYLYKLLEVAIKQTHGALIVISQQAELEAKRFSGQSVPILPFQITNKTILQLTAIDGALLIDPQGKCFALGTILDGEATGEGDAARGSRYNSALRYVSTRRTRGEQCLAIVVSTDGMINLL